MSKISNSEYAQFIRLPLEIKIQKSLIRIREWYEYNKGMVSVSFSGGKDSTVLLDLVRSVYPDVPAVFIDTGLEYPEIKDFVNQTSNVTIIRPMYSFAFIIKKYGYPVISKQIASIVQLAKNDSKTAIEKLNGELMNNGRKSAYNCKKYKYLIDAPFKISAQCCYHLKKAPANLYKQETGNQPYCGTLATESRLRRVTYLRNGCNHYEGKNAVSNPLSFWNEEDIWNYIKKRNIPYSKIYDMGIDRSGCVFCCFGISSDRHKFDRLKLTHPKLYDFCIDKLGLKEVLEYVLKG